MRRVQAGSSYEAEDDDTGAFGYSKYGKGKRLSGSKRGARGWGDNAEEDEDAEGSGSYGGAGGRAGSRAGGPSGHSSSTGTGPGLGGGFRAGSDLVPPTMSAQWREQAEASFDPYQQHQQPQQHYQQAGMSHGQGSVGGGGGAGGAGGGAGAAATVAAGGGTINKPYKPPMALGARRRPGLPPPPSGSGAAGGAAGGGGGGSRPAAGGAGAAGGAAGRSGGGGGSFSSGSDAAAAAAAGGEKSGPIWERYGEDLPEQLKGLEESLIKDVEGSIATRRELVSFKDVAGLADAKAVMVESVIWPMSNPELFTGLTRAERGEAWQGGWDRGGGGAVTHSSFVCFGSSSALSSTSLALPSLQVCSSSAPLAQARPSLPRQWPTNASMPHSSASAPAPSPASGWARVRRWSEPCLQ